MSRSKTSGPNRHRWAWRLFFLTMLALHAPATWSAISSVLRPTTGETAWSSLLLLSLSNLFFLFEISFAYSLHLVTNRRAALALLLVICLLHVGVVERGLPASVRVSESRYWTILAAVGAAWIGGLLRILAALRSLQFGDPAADWRRRWAAWLYGPALTPLVAWRPRLSRWRGAALRAPPSIHL